MVSLLSRLWTGFVGVVAGTALGLVLAVVLVQSGFTLDAALYSVAACGAVGGLLAFLTARPKGSSPSERS